MSTTLERHGRLYRSPEYQAMLARHRAEMAEMDRQQVQRLQALAKRIETTEKEK